MTRIRRKRWTPSEDDLLRAAAERNVHYGITCDAGEGYENRLRELAGQLNRTYASVRIRASRMGFISYPNLKIRSRQRRVDDE